MVQWVRIILYQTIGEGGKRNAAGIVIVKKTYHLHLENLEWETISELTA